MNASAPIGVFDSGYGGLTVLKELQERLPLYDFIYLGDNARAPYGSRSFDTVYEYTLESVKWLLRQGCQLVIIACNTSSSKALRTIQQKFLPGYAPQKRVLGVIRPTAEIIGNHSTSRHIGILGTKGTIQSGSYLIEIEKFFPGFSLYQQACPMWVPLVENNEYQTEGAAYFIRRDIDRLLSQSPEIDTILLACTHYPLLRDQIQPYLPEGVRLVSQGTIVAKSLEDYLYRHPEMDALCTKTGNLQFFSTDDQQDFESHSAIFFGRKVKATHVEL